jgi:Tfp pilus assembly protein FimT
LVVISIVAVIAGVVITQFDSVSHDQLLGTAQVVAADIAHARNLAVTNNSSYKITFDRGNNRYALAHSGTNSALNVLPISAFHSASGSTTQQITDLASLPIGAGGVHLAVVESNDPMMVSFPTQVYDVEFGPLGETTRATGTTIWLSANAQRGRRFLGIDVDPITGLASIGTIQTSVPQSLMMEEMNSYAPTSTSSTNTGSTSTGSISSDPATATTF